MVYSWKVDTLPVKAQVAGEFIEKLEEKHGEVTPKVIVDASRKKNAPLHRCFEWDDTKAAERYRETQAAALLRNLTVTVEPIADETPKTVRAFVKATEKKGSYISVISALSNEHLRESLLQSALAELREFQKKYADLQELSEVFAAASALQARIA